MKKGEKKVQDFPLENRVAQRADKQQNSFWLTLPLNSRDFTQLITTTTHVLQSCQKMQVSSDTLKETLQYSEKLHSRNVSDKDLHLLIWKVNRSKKEQTVSTKLAAG